MRLVMIFLSLSPLIYHSSLIQLNSSNQTLKLSVFVKHWVVFQVRLSLSEVMTEVVVVLRLRCLWWNIHNQFTFTVKIYTL
jgi:hypothetical protein